MNDIWKRYEELQRQDREECHEVLRSINVKYERLCQALSQDGLQMSDIWKRHVELQQQEQEERVELLAPLRAKYDLLHQALSEECGKIKHKFVLSRFNVGGDSIYRCSECGKTSHFDSIEELGQK
jgi:hypothetical protein